MAAQTQKPITADLVVQDVVERYPQTIKVFVRFRLNCVGCYIAPFHTLNDTAHEYALAVELLLKELNQAAAPDAAGAT